MKILHIIPSLHRGGAERLALDICIEINKRRNHEVRLVTFANLNGYGNLSDQIQWDVVPSQIKLSLFGVENKGIKPLENYIKKFEPDIIHTHLFEAEIVSRSVDYPFAKWISHCHDNMQQFQCLGIHSFFSRKRLTDYFEKNYLLSRYKINGGNHFIAISNDTKKYFESVLPDLLQSNVHLLFNAIDFKKFNCKNHARQINKINMINVGSFLPKKNQIFLVDVMNELKGMNIDATLTLLGDGNEVKKVQQRIAEYNLGAYVSIRNHVANVEDYLYEANLYVHSATYEAFGLVLMEAMSAGLPVISLDGKGNQDIVKNNFNGFLVQDYNPKIYAQKIIDLMGDKKKYFQLSLNALEFSKHFDIVNYIDQLLSLYGKL